jgi:hypothetical protein
VRGCSGGRFENRSGRRRGWRCRRALGLSLGLAVTACARVAERRLLWGGAIAAQQTKQHDSAEDQRSEQQNAHQRAAEAIVEK